MCGDQKNTMRRGSAAVVAMVYLVLMSALAMAMASVATLNIRMAYNTSDVERARASAETGIRWFGWKLSQIPLVQTDVGTITDKEALRLWPQIRDAVIADLNGTVTASTRMNPVPPIDTVTSAGHLLLGDITGPNGATFNLDIWPTPGAERTIQVKVSGLARDARRALQMEFFLQKTMKYGVLSSIPIQLGKNTTVQGDICVVSMTGSGLYGNQPPVLAISDFRYTDTTTTDALTRHVAAFQTFLTTNDPTHDNRIRVSDAVAMGALATAKANNSNLATAVDYNSDGFIDEFDLFLQYFETGGDKRVSQSEFNAKAPKDLNLFKSIDERGRPWNSSETPPTSYLDGYADTSDQYAKIQGHVRIRESEASVTARLATVNYLDNSTGQTRPEKFADVLQGPVSPVDNLNMPSVEFNATDLANISLNPSDFKMTDFLNLSGKRAGVTALHPGAADPDIAAVYADTLVKAGFDAAGARTGDANGTTNSTQIAKLTSSLSSKTVAVTTTGNQTSVAISGLLDPQNSSTTTTETLGYTTETIGGQTVGVLRSVTENIPYGTSDNNRRSRVKRPVFSNVTFRNCVIYRGTNALFLNCKFDGVTFVDGSYDMQKPLDKLPTNPFYADGNNFRFESCSFTGPIAQGDARVDSSGDPLSSQTRRGEAPGVYGDATNSWEFTGATGFDLSVPKDDTSDLGKLKKQATIMAPRTNIEMGSFITPGVATCSFQGVVVAGCFDVRGIADIDGSIIVTKNDGPGNCTLGYFGPSDDVGNAGTPDPSMVAQGGSYGKIHIRYNPFRSLPNGINMRVSLLPDTTSWREVAP